MARLTALSGQTFFSQISIRFISAIAFPILLLGCSGAVNSDEDTAVVQSGLKVTLVSGNNQIQARRKYYTLPIKVKVSPNGTRFGVANITVRFKSLTNSGATFPTTATTDENGDASIQVLSPNFYGSTVQIEASATGASGSVVFTLTTIPDTVSTVSFGVPPPASYIADDVTPIPSFKVFLKDSYGYVMDPNSTDSITLSVVNGSSTLSGTLTQQMTYGMATFSGLTYQKAEVMTIRATHPPSGLYADHIIQVKNAALSQLAFSAPLTGPYVTDEVFAPIVELRDRFGNVVTEGVDASASISLALRQGSGTLGGTTSSVASSGVASFAGKNISISAVGTNKILRASYGSFFKDTDVFTIVAPPAPHLRIVGPQTIKSGGCEAFNVTSRDASGNLTNVSVLTNIDLNSTGSGQFYSDALCASSITTSSIAMGASSKTVYFKDNSAESVTLSASDPSLTFSFGTLSVVIGPSQLIWTGTASPLVDTCTAYSISAKDTNNSNANVLAATSIALSGDGNGSFYSDNQCLNTVSSTSIAQGSFFKTIYYKNSSGESLTFLAEDNAGNLAAGSKAILTDCGVTSLEVTLADGTDTVLAGGEFDVKIVAKAGATTKTCFSGSHPISWTMNGATATTLDCGQANGIPKPPTESSLVFTNGEAMTTSNVALFKALQSTATISAASGSLNGTSENITVGVGEVCRLRLRTASGGGGSFFTNDTIDLNVSSATPTSFVTVYAAGYDAFGNYNSDVSATWSGTGGLNPWPKTTTQTGDTASVYGVKIGTGSISANYDGGGGTKTATASITVTSTHAIGTLTTATTDSAGRSHLGSNSIHQAKHWDTTSNPVTAWKTDSTKAWHSEAFSTTRGSRKSFPDQVFLAATPSGLDILDATNNHLFMRFNVGAGYALDSTFGEPVAAAGLNGKIYVSMRDSGATTGSFVILDFVSNTITRYNALGKFTWNGGGLQSRNTAGTWNHLSWTPALDNSAVFTTAARRIGTVDYVLVGTKSGLHLYQDNAGVYSMYRDSTTNPIKAAQLTSDGKIYYAEDLTGVHRFDATLPLSGDWAPTRTYSNSSSVNLGLKSLNDLKIAEGTSPEATGANTIVTATNEGLSVIQEHTAFGMETSKTYTPLGTGYTPFLNILNFNGTSGSASMTDANAITRLATSEVLVKPFETWTSSSPAAYIFDRGSLAADSYGIRFNASGTGAIECYNYKSTTVTSVPSTTVSWTAGQWYHIACVYSNSGNGMRITIYVNGVAQNNTVVSFMNTWDGNTGTIYFGSRGGVAGFLNGSIDEFRLSNNIRYTGNFTVPSASFGTDANTYILHHFDSDAGSTAPATTGNDASLNTGAWFSTPLFGGTSHSVSGVSVNVQGTTATADLVCTGAGSSWSELTDLHTTDATLSTSTSGIEGQSIDLYQVDGATDSDLLIGLKSGGLRLQRR